MSHDQLTPEQFRELQQLVKEHAEIIIRDDQQYLVECRLAFLQKKLDENEYLDLINNLRTAPTKSIQMIINIMSTNETSFYRDAHPFELLKQELLPTLMKDKPAKSKIRIWCAACSTGQEPYSIVMMLKQELPILFLNYDLEVLATDIDTDALQRAKDGVYSQLEVNRGLPARLLATHFERQGIYWAIREDIKKHIRFEQLNLAKPWNNINDVDIIFLRNVLIYFDKAVREGILQRMHASMNPGSALILGSSESLMNLQTEFKLNRATKSGYYTPNK